MRVAKGVSWVLLIDKHMQWLLLWCIPTQQTLQANNVDWGLEWMVSLLCVFLLYNLNLKNLIWNERPTILCLCLCKRFTEFGGPLHHRPAEDLAFAVARFIQKGGSFVNYYMVGSPFFLSLLVHFLKGPEIFTMENLILVNWAACLPCEQYHGGTNFGRTAGGPFITTSYDYDAPIDEYGEKKSYLLISTLFVLLKYWRIVTAALGFFNLFDMWLLF